MPRKGKNQVNAVSPAAGLFPVEVDGPAPEVKVIVGQLPLWIDEGRRTENCGEAQWGSALSCLRRKI